MNFVSLFAGIGGIDLGLERAGLTCVAQVEIDPFCRAILHKHWPTVPKFEDVRHFNRSSIDGNVDLVAGGFPCQDISVAGKGAGIKKGTRSGLWREMFRVVRQFRPAWVLAENVPALKTRGYDRVYDALERIGYAVRPVVVGAWAVGAPHTRERVFVVANTHGALPPGGVRPEGSMPANFWRELEEAGEDWDRRFAQLESMGLASRATSYADALRVLDGIPDRVERIRGCGNAVVPHVAQAVGEWFMHTQRELNGGAA